MTIRDSISDKDLEISFDLCVGADGSYSIIRRQMMRVVRCVIYVLMRLCEALMLPIDTINSTWHISIGQNGLSTRIHQRWIYRIKNADRPRQWWKADVSSRSRASTHMAKTLFHAYCSSKQSTKSHHLSPLLSYHFLCFHRIKHLHALYSRLAPSSNASVAPMPYCLGSIFIFPMRCASLVRKT